MVEPWPGMVRFNPSAKVGAAFNFLVKDNDRSGEEPGSSQTSLTFWKEHCLCLKVRGGQEASVAAVAVTLGTESTHRAGGPAPSLPPSHH